MLINYIKITLRNLMKNRVQSGINILGLSVGIGVSLLMLLFAWNVLTYDQFHENSDDLYFLYRTRPAPEGGTLTTLRYAQQYSKPMQVVSLDRTEDDSVAIMANRRKGTSFGAAMGRFRR